MDPDTACQFQQQLAEARPPSCATASSSRSRRETVLRAGRLMRWMRWRVAAIFADQAAAAIQSLIVHVRDREEADELVKFKPSRLRARRCVSGRAGVDAGPSSPRTLALGPPGQRRTSHSGGARSPRTPPLRRAPGGRRPAEPIACSEALTPLRGASARRRAADMSPKNCGVRSELILDGGPCPLGIEIHSDRPSMAGRPVLLRPGCDFRAAISNGCFGPLQAPGRHHPGPRA